MHFTNNFLKHPPLESFNSFVKIKYTRNTLNKYKILFILIAGFFSLKVSAGEQTHQFKAAIQISTNISDGQYSLYEIAQTSQKLGIDVLIPAERDYKVWEYGLWPLENLVKKRVESRSLLHYGQSKYLETAKAVENKLKNITIIPGVESAPHYYWQGSVFKKNLIMYDWHKHLLAIGLSSYKDYEKMPVISNKKGLIKGFNFLKTWPVLLLGYLIFYIKGKGRFKKIAGFLIFIAILFLINNWPFLNYKFNQYQSDLGVLPYQQYINYVKSKKGLCFWSHPQAKYLLSREGIDFETLSHQDHLLETENYTGFLIFPEGYKDIGKPGKIWDKILIQYCQGKREKPIWAIGGLAFEVGNLKERLKNLQTIILAPNQERESILEALESGRAYVVKGPRSLDFRLDEFSIKDGEDSAEIADSIDIRGNPVLSLRGSFLDEQQTVEIKIIKAGEVVKIYEVTTPFDLHYSQEDNPGAKTYYRVEIKGRGLHFISNPIFVNLAK